MLRIIVGFILIFIGCIVYIASLKTIKEQIVHTGKREFKLVFTLILGLTLAAIGGRFIGYGLISI